MGTVETKDFTPYVVYTFILIMAIIFIYGVIDATLFTVERNLV